MNFSWAVCRCFFHKNIFIPELGHVEFHGRQQFEKTYLEGLRKLDKASVIADIEAEIDRRRNINGITYINYLVIKEKYNPLNSQLFNKKTLLSLQPTIQGVTECIDGVFNFPLMSLDQCGLLIEEIKHFKKSKLQHQRPNSMNKNGILFTELGLDYLIRSIVDAVQPLAQAKFPALVGSTGFDSFKAFTVEYATEASADQDLATHFDNAEVTLNIPLYTENQEGNELIFQTKRGFRPQEMEIGRAILHAGSQQHGVLPITSGSRCNLIIWMRSSEIRNRECPMCKQSPDLEEVEFGKGDGFKIWKVETNCASVGTKFM